MWCTTRSMTAAAAVGSRQTSDQRANGRFVVTTEAAALVALADEAEEQVGAGLVHRHVAKLVDDHDVEARGATGVADVGGHGGPSDE